MPKDRFKDAATFFFGFVDTFPLFGFFRLRQSVSDTEAADSGKWIFLFRSLPSIIDRHE